jgi:hypothetical protein
MKLFRSASVHSLLSNLKSIVEFVIRFPGDSLTSQYGAIERIRSDILSILSHGLRQVCHHQEKGSDFSSQDLIRCTCYFTHATQLYSYETECFLFNNILFSIS